MTCLEDSDETKRNYPVTEQKVPTFVIVSVVALFDWPENTLGPQVPNVIRVVSETTSSPFISFIGQYNSLSARCDMQLSQINSFSPDVVVWGASERMIGRKMVDVVAGS